MCRAPTHSCILDVTPDRGIRHACVVPLLSVAILTEDPLSVSFPPGHLSLQATQHTPEIQYELVELASDNHQAGQTTYTTSLIK